MKQKKQLPRKHAAKKCTSMQEGIIREIQSRKKLSSWIEAKHEYFENQEKYDKSFLSELDKEKEEPAHTETEEIATEQQPPKKKRLCIEETKLGVTLVLSHDDCKELGFSGKETTGTAIEDVRVRLGLQTRAQLREATK